MTVPLIEETFAIGCFHGWETKFAKINFTRKDFHPLCTDKFLQKKFFNLFHKINFGEKDFLVYSEKKKLPRKKIPTKINTKNDAKNFNKFT